MYVTISFTHLGFGTRPPYHLKIVLEQSTKNTTRQKYIIRRIKCFIDLSLIVVRVQYNLWCQSLRAVLSNVNVILCITVIKRKV